MDHTRPEPIRPAHRFGWGILLSAALAVCCSAVLGWTVPDASAQSSSLYLRMILVKDKAAAAKVSNLLSQGKGFADLARQFSTDPTKGRGGFLGRVALKDLNEQVQAMVGTLKVGGFTGPVRVKNGLAFFQRTTTAHYTFALELMKAEKYKQALVPLEKDLALNPDRIHSRALKAYAFQRLNRTKEAKDAYREIIRRDPKNVLANNNLGTLLDQEGNYTEAAKRFERAVAIEPNQDVTLHNLAWIYSSRLGRPSKALRFIRKAIELKPNAANYYTMLASIYRQLGKTLEARKAVTQAVQLEPANAEHRKLLAMLGGPLKEPAPAKKTPAKPGGRANARTPPGDDNPPASVRARLKPAKKKPPSKAATPRKRTASVRRAAPSSPSIKVVTRLGGGKTVRLVGRLLRRNGYPVALRLKEAKPMKGIRIYYKGKSVGAARKIRNLISPKPQLRRMSWNSQFDIIVFVGR
ncbi:MAG TPA: tetratricopeptide repeat protein [Nitrospinota bacterium]|nr:tetratricopeptide repeat protein [Nitrospinota bacterium]